LFRGLFVTVHRTAILAPRAETGGRTSSAVVAVEAAEEGYRRLGVISAVIAAAALLGIAIAIAEFVAVGNDPVRSAAVNGVAGVSALAVFVGSRRKLFPVRRFAVVALSVEVLVAVGLGAGLLGWQHRLGALGVAWLDTGGAPPFGLGAGGVPWVGIWILMFATIIPLGPRLHLLGGVLSATTLVIWPLVSIAAQGIPEVIQPVWLQLTAGVMVWVGFRGFLTAGMGYLLALSVYGLRKQLARARRLGSYQLQEKLGEGGMGEVWRADHQMLARPAAIKLIRSGGGDTGTPWHEMTHRFEREVQAAAGLRSPHTIEIYDYGMTDDGVFYYVMELLDGLDLAKLVEVHGPIAWPRVTHLLKQVCHSLAEAHERGMVHRDIKPANIFLCRVGRDTDQVKVLDFGLVKTTTSTAADAALTQKGTFVGTPAYAPPELGVGGFEQADARSDLYSLGCVAHWLLTGRTVFDAVTPVDMLIKHARDEPTAPSRVSELEIPEALDRIVLDCLAKDPARRPASADELATRLGELDPLGVWTASQADAWWARHRPAVPAGV